MRSGHGGAWCTKTKGYDKVPSETRPVRPPEFERPHQDRRIIVKEMVNRQNKSFKNLHTHNEELGRPGHNYFGLVHRFTDGPGDYKLTLRISRLR